MTIFVVDDEPLAVESLRSNISKAIDAEALIRGYANSKDALAEIDEFRPDTVFLDI